MTSPVDLTETDRQMSKRSSQAIETGQAVKIKNRMKLMKYDRKLEENVEIEVTLDELPDQLPEQIRDAVVASRGEADDIVVVTKRAHTELSLKPLPEKQRRRFELVVDEAMKPGSGRPIVFFISESEMGGATTLAFYPDTSNLGIGILTLLWQLDNTYDTEETAPACRERLTTLLEACANHVDNPFRHASPVFQQEFGVGTVGVFTQLYRDDD